MNYAVVPPAEPLPHCLTACW